VFDAKVAILVLDDLPLWQKLNVTAFLATGIAGAALDAMGEPYEDGAGRRYARLLGQPDPDICRHARRPPTGAPRISGEAPHLRGLCACDVLDR
jgi:hypothetical protein